MVYELRLGIKIVAPFYSISKWTLPSLVIDNGIRQLVTYIVMSVNKYNKRVYLYILHKSNFNYCSFQLKPRSS